MEIEIRNGCAEDIPGIKQLYENVAETKGGLARTKDEVTNDFVECFAKKSISRGVILVAVEKSSQNIIGEIHCYCSGIKVFAHVLSGLTIAVHSKFQGQKIGRMLFEKLLDLVGNEMQHILRVELFARESNVRAIKFYESLGFKIEGRFESRIKSVGGGFEADIPMAWTRQ